MNVFPSVGYIFFEKEVALPSHYPVSPHENAPLVMDSLNIPEFGLVLPLSRTVPDGDKITKEYIEKTNGDLQDGTVFIALDADGYVNEYCVSKTTGKLINYPYPKARTKFIKTNAAYLNGQFNRSVEKVYSIDSAIMQFEKITGISADTFTIYNREDLVKYIKGEVLLEEIPSRPGKTQYVFTWLGEKI